MTKAPIALVVLLVALSTASAQDGPEARVHVRTGFVPDPAELEGHAHGVRPVSAIAPTGEGCDGLSAHFAASPSHVLSLDSRFGFLRVFATSSTNLALLVRDSAGRWLCSDDRFGEHPSVESVFAPGRVEIWVGTHDPGAEGDYVLRLTETRTVRPGAGSDADGMSGRSIATEIGLAVDTSAARFGEIRLRRGFLPDPRFLTGTAGGALDVSLVGGACRGFVEGPPSHVIRLLEGFGYLQLSIAGVEERVDPEGPTTLVVLAPDGHLYCDTSEGDQPQVARTAWPEGDYLVWVGSQRSDASIAYRLRISELVRVR